MKNVRKSRTGVVAGVVAAIALSGALWPALAGPSPAAVPPAADRARGGDGFYCGLFLSVKYVSLFTGNVNGVLIGAIGGGIACGMGW